jgi:broad specificity phosphatase PhoE
VVAVVTHLDVLRSLMALEIEEELGIFPDWTIAQGSYLRLVRGRSSWRRMN